MVGPTGPVDPRYRWMLAVISGIGLVLVGADYWAFGYRGRDGPYPPDLPLGHALGTVLIPAGVVSLMIGVVMWVRQRKNPDDDEKNGVVLGLDGLPEKDAAG